ncbi:hypothetical protein [Candidatus Pantoea multigeneris]|uniref:hypothetical protein n=1 Tax=Candidatus Pantoea multigeneris TaxID=2608357 RepID=UPI00141E359F|nr:hypothetical protein [Pantoea multigeneris]
MSTRHLLLFLLEQEDLPLSAGIDLFAAVIGKAILPLPSLNLCFIFKADDQHFA